MSDTAIQNPFGVNLVGSLLDNKGLCINPITAALVGTSHTVTSYTPGTLVTDTCLNDLTRAIKAGYDTLGTNLDVATYANLISIGSATIPALGNSKPPTYTWIGPANSGDPSSTSAQAVSWYPYTATATTNTYPTSNPTPRQWSDLTSTTYSPAITQWGWIRVFALQAWNEFNWNGAPAASSVAYRDFLSSFQTCASYAAGTNATINTLTSASTFLKNTYSNNNDLMSADITGVNLATADFGKDLIATGKVIDLSTIDKFGLPSNLLFTLNKYNALTPSVSYALLSAGLSVADVTNILNGTAVPTKLQEQQIYGAFSIIIGKDLESILVVLNCTTKNVVSLVDLLNPKVLFPTSYPSLTVPIYNSGPGPTNAKTYYTVYVNGGVNPQLSTPQVINAIGTAGVAPISTTAPDVGTNFQVQPVGYGAYSRGIIPDEVSIASGAFSFAMQQITNIKNVPIEKFAQVVSNIETLAGLDLVGGSSVPTNTAAANVGLDQIAYGSGPNGTFTLSDFFGCMSGLPYQWTDIKKLIKQLQTPTLSSIYANIYATISTAIEDVSPIVQGYIDAANAEIASIMSKNSNEAAQLNKMWKITGIQLSTEQRARDMALNPVPVPQSSKLGSFPYSAISFVNAMQGYAKKTEPHMQAQTLEAISDMTTVGGQSQIALLRSMRNQEKIKEAGIPIDNNMPDDLNPLTTKIWMGNGTVSIGRQNQGVPATCEATFTIPADLNVLPTAKPLGYFENEQNSYYVAANTAPAPVLGTIPDCADVGQDLAGPNITQVNNVITPIAGGHTPQGPFDPLNLGNPAVPGSLAGNPYQNVIAPQLSVPYLSGVLSAPTYGVADAIEEVVRCNCDCWL